MRFPIRLTSFPYHDSFLEYHTECKCVGNLCTQPLSNRAHHGSQSPALWHREEAAACAAPENCRSLHFRMSQELQDGEAADRDSVRYTSGGENVAPLLPPLWPQAGYSGAPPNPISYAVFCLKKKIRTPLEQVSRFMGSSPRSPIC